MKLKISVVTTTKGGPIDNLATSLYPFYNEIHEFIIVDANSHRRQSSKLYKYPKVKIIDGRGTLRGGGKNLGIAEATGNVIVFLNDDTRVTSQWINELKCSIEKAAIVAGWSPPPKGQELARVPIYINGQDITYPACNIAYRSEVFDIVGYFDPNMVTAEDIDFNLRCVDKGYIIDYNPMMKVYHHHRKTFRAFARQAFWNGYGRKQFNKKYPSLKHSHQHGLRFKNIARLCFGALGYILGGTLYHEPHDS